ncbi:MAG: sulfotransferase [Okeania sp. SIO3I5]|uniref:sulfotransferase family protein n=1 Tax=Okeania sp. SIO3I5 TaxID=2607805 RepID=UPI0013BAEE2B|nr:sulfotransferase [Okeania sp. SIO3I5]NEQ39106.1 sulfotransferase [Okeania sp. SIO3I5]
MNQERIKKRIFVVGCPRSGTTLLQSMLAAHPQIASLVESHFCGAIFDNRGFYRKKFGLASKLTRKKLNKCLEEIGFPEMKQHLPKFGLFASQYVKGFVKILDLYTQQQNQIIWLEKTPKHLHYIDDLERYIKNIKFIHIIRNGADVVASLFDVTQQYPDIWGGARDIDTCIQRWIEDINLTKYHLSKFNHTLVEYEKLVENPTEVLTEVCQFVGVEFTEKMLQDYQVVAKQVTLKNEPWKASVGEKLNSSNSKKFQKLFNQEQQTYILKRLSEVRI